MRIGEFSRALGLSASTVRFYESLGLIPRAPRVSGHRWYDQQLLTRTRLVVALGRAGFRLVEIKALLGTLRQPNAAEHWQRAARDKLVELEQSIAELSRARALLEGSLDCECEGDAPRCRLLTAIPPRR